MSLNDFLRAYLRAVTYLGFGELPRRFYIFLEERLEFTKEKRPYEQMGIHEFGSLTGIRFVPFALFQSDDPSMVSCLVERVAIEYLQHVDQDLCLNTNAGTSEASTDFRMNYVVIIPDREKLYNEHGILVKQLVCNEADIGAPGSAV